MAARTAAGTRPPTLLGAPPPALAGVPSWTAAAETPSVVEPASLPLPSGATTATATFTITNVDSNTPITYSLAHVAALSYRLLGDGVMTTRDWVEASLARAQLPPTEAAAAACFFVEGHAATYVTVPAGLSVAVKVCACVRACVAAHVRASRAAAAEVRGGRTGQTHAHT